MGMTNDEILDDVNERWLNRSLGNYARPTGYYLSNMQFHYNSILGAYYDHTISVSYHVIWILAYTWGLLRHREDLSDAGNSPSPKIVELTDFPLELEDIDWDFVERDDYIMMINTYMDDLEDAWKDDVETRWSDASVTASRYLFEICKQYLLSNGVAEGAFQS